MTLLHSFGDGWYGVVVSPPDFPSNQPERGIGTKRVFGEDAEEEGGGESILRL